MFVAKGLAIKRLDPRLLLLGASDSLVSIDINALIQQLGSDGEMIAVRRLDESRALLFLEFKLTTDDAESKKTSAVLVSALVSLPDCELRSWQLASDVIGIMDIGNSEFLLEYSDGHYGKISCDFADNTVGIAEVISGAPIDIQANVFWSARPPNGSSLTTRSELFTPSPQTTNPIRIKIGDELVDWLTLTHDRIAALRSERSVGVWFPSGRYSIHDFSITQRRLLVRGESGRLQIIDVKTESADDSGNPNEERQKRVSESVNRYLVMGRPDLCRMALGEWFSFPLNFYNLSWALLLLAEIQCNAGMLQQAVETLQLLTDELAQATEVPVHYTAFIQRRVAAITLRAELSEVSSVQAIGDILDELNTILPDFDVVVFMMLVALEGYIVADERRCVFAEKVIVELQSRMAKSGQPTFTGATALQFLSTLLSRTSKQEQITASEVDWNNVVPADLHSLLERASSGSVDAQVDLGARFGLGNGVAKQPRYAVFWYECAVQNGSAIAARNLAQMYRHGEGVSRDPETVVKYLRIASDRGDTMARTNLATCLLHGYGHDRDVTEARRLYLQSDEEGHDLATMALASLEVSGVAGEPNHAKAVALLEPLALRGNRQAIMLLSALMKRE